MVIQQIHSALVRSIAMYKLYIISVKSSEEFVAIYILVTVNLPQIYKKMITVITYMRKKYYATKINRYKCRHFVTSVLLTTNQTGGQHNERDSNLPKTTEYQERTLILVTIMNTHYPQCRAK